MLKTIFEALAEIFKFFNNIFISPKKQIRKVVRIYEAMSRIVNQDTVQRVLISRIHNSGGVIKPNTELFASVLYEDYCHPFSSVKKEYQRLPLDKNFIKMLMDIMENGKMYYKQANITSEMVRNLYIKEGVLVTMFYYLGQDKKNIYMCTCSVSADNGDLLTPQHFVPIELEINVIRQNIK